MILIFGANGMLGRYVYQELLSMDTVYPFTRRDFDIVSDDWSILCKLLDDYQPDVIVNCAGLIPQKGPYSVGSYFRVNTMFPHKLQNYCEKHKCQLIHITTDCVYSGIKGFYHEIDPSDNSVDLYGISKYLGEPLDACILRTSILGEELTHKKSLLEWVRHQTTINGYVNHYWNGVTCLKMAEIIKEIILNRLFWKGVRHVHSPNIATKYELCQWICDLYNVNCRVVPFLHEKTIDRSLNSLYPRFSIEPIQEQLKKQKEYRLCPTTEF